MSASWPSERDPGAARAAPPVPAARAGARARWAVLAALLGLALALGADRAPAASASRADSGGQVRHVTVSDRGIVVDRVSVEDTATGDGAGRAERRRAAGAAARTAVRSAVRSAVGTEEPPDGESGLVHVDARDAGIVRICSDALVPAGQHVDGDVVAVFGSVTVEGSVSRDVVAVLGSVRLKSGARVDGDVVSIGGRLDQEEGATIRGESVQLGFAPLTLGLPGASVLLFAVMAGWLVSLFVGWILALLFPTGLLRVATVVERRPAASFFLGLLSVPMFFLALVLLSITVIGIPLAVLLPMVYMVLGYAGQLAATMVLGARLARRSPAGGLMVPLLVGTLFVAVLMGAGAALTAGGGAAQTASLFLSLLGLLLLICLGALGTGAVLLSRFGTRPPDVVWHGHPRSSPSPGPMPGPVSPATPG